MPIELVAERFDATKLVAVASLDCGNDEHGRIATAWIKSQNPDDSALSDIQQVGTEVYLYYEKSTNELVGFGSLGLTSRQIRGQTLEFSIIPHIGIDARFHGYPKGVPWDERVAALIMLDLIDRASRLPPNELTLYVHKDNGRARKLYDRLGFKPIGNINQTGHQRMILQVPR